jgi:hypothetical protein
MGMINMHTGVETPWPEFFCPGYKLESVKAIMTDDFIVGSIRRYTDIAVPQTTLEDRVSDLGVRYTILVGHRFFFNSTHHHAQPEFRLRDWVWSRLQDKLLRGFQNDDSDEAEEFARHVGKLVRHWWEGYQKTDEYLKMFRETEARIGKHNTSEQSRVRDIEGAMKCRR